MCEVLTLEEASQFLRIAEAEVLELAEKGDLPGRKIQAQWRFLKQALQDWLRQPSPKQRLLQHAGAAKDDPNLDSIVERAFRERGRPAVKSRR